MTRDLQGDLQTSLDSGCTTLCLAWLVTRQDGTILGFTDHDEDIVIEGQTYTAMTSFTATAIEDQLGLAVSNLEVMGGLSSDAITDDDLAAGRYDSAVVTIFLANWADTTQYVILVRGTVGQVHSGNIAFQAELRSLGQHFAQYIGSICGPKCRSNLGDTGKGLEGGCRFSMPAPVAGVIASVTDRTTFSVTASGSFPAGTKGSLSGGYFDYGSVKFTSGANDGVSREIRSSDDTVAIVTRMPFPLDIQVGDTVELQIGCDRTLPVCVQNFNNAVNYRGEPYVPGRDFVFRVNGE